MRKNAFQAGAVPYLKNDQGETPLDLARTAKYARMIELLELWGAKTDQKVQPW